jgi:hypothetical protein
VNVGEDAQGPDVGSAVERWTGILSSVVAPVTLVTGLLFYFGYVSSRAQFLYFGVDVDTIGLSTQDYVMRSPQALLVPLLVIAIGAALLLLAHRRLRRTPLPAGVLRVALWCAGLVLVTGLALLLGYPLVASWPPYALVTPLLIAAGTAGVVYLLRMPGAPGRRPAAEDRAPWVGPAVLGLALVVVATCLFWATATVAQWSGDGLAKRTARELGQLPAVILDTTERLYLTDPVVEETALPQQEGETYRYRYRGLRLLIQGPDAMYLVPETWSASNSTLRVPFDDTVRVQFRFVNSAP